MRGCVRRQLSKNVLWLKKKCQLWQHKSLLMLQALYKQDNTSDRVETTNSSNLQKTQPITTLSQAPGTSRFWLISKLDLTSLVLKLSSSCKDSNTRREKATWSLYRTWTVWVRVSAWIIWESLLMDKIIRQVQVLRATTEGKQQLVLGPMPLDKSTWSPSRPQETAKSSPMLTRF